MFSIRFGVIAPMLLLCLSVSAQVERGKATYYSRRATGARTSSGERLHHDSLTCAHKRYPFGTLLKVTNPGNGKSVEVRVNDRGPYGKGKIIDLSYEAAQQIGMLAQGVVMVEVEVLQYPSPQAPLKQEESIEIPDIDLQIGEMGYSYIKEWGNAAAKAPTAKEKAEALKQQKAKNTKKPPTKQQPAGSWRKIFKNIKDWF